MLVWIWGQVSGLFSFLSIFPYLPLYLFVAINTLFLERFLYLQRYATKLSRFARIFCLVVLAVGGLTWWSQPLSIAGIWFCAIVMAGLAFAGGFASFKGGMRSALYSAAAYAIFGLAVLWGQLSGTDEQSGFSANQLIVMLCGCALFMLLLAFALVSKFTSIAKRNIASSESLEQKILQRTEQLENVNTDLEKLAQDLTSAGEAKNTFLVNMSHEMRTPLTAIIGYADGLAQGDIVAEEKNKALTVIRKNGEHLLAIINDLLDISKIENDSLEVESKPFDPLAMMQDIAVMTAAQVEQKHLKFSVLYRLPLPCEVCSDAKRVRQILLNIINNAVKFTHQGEIEVMVNVAGPKMVFSVSDTGIGMNQSQLDLIFQAFSQEDLTKSRQYGGLGLGLNIAKSLADKLNAQIEVSSTQGQGSTFTVSFDMGLDNKAHWIENQPQLDQWLKKISQEQQSSEQLPQIGGDILLAEDHPDNQKLFIRLLERMGLDVTAVDNGYQAVQATLENDFDVILMDIQMPEMDGLKAFELISASGTDVPVIALTANAMKADVDLYMGMGFKDHIAKPIDREYFAQTILKYLNIESKVEMSLEIDEMDEIKQQFVVRLVKRVDDIRAAEAKQDWEDIGKHAHAIKGSAGMFGFDHLGSLGASLELSVKNNEQDLCRTHLSELLDVCEQITADIK